MLYPKQFMYAIVTTSFESFFIDENTEVSHRYGGRTSGFIGNGSSLAHCQQFRLAMRDVPALREEPYITTMEDYIPKVQLQLAAWAVPSGGIERVMKTWESVIEELLKWKEFGQRLDADGSIHGTLESTDEAYSALGHRRRARPHAFDNCPAEQMLVVRPR